MLTQISIIHPQQHQSNLLRNDASRINDDDSSRSQNISEFNFCHQSSKVDSDVADVGCSEILSQDFFWYFSILARFRIYAYDNYNY